MTCKHLRNGACSLGLYGGQPSPGVCWQCESYDGPVRGLGDVIDKATSATGIKRLASKRGCNCHERRIKLNGTPPE